MSISNRMHDRLCKLYRLVLVRMRNIEAALAVPMLGRKALPARKQGEGLVPNGLVRMARDVADATGHSLERLEPRVLLSGTSPALAGMHLADADTANWQGQIVYLDFDGEAGVMFDGAVDVGPLDIPVYEAPQSQAGQEEAIKAQVLEDVQSFFAGTGVQLTLVRPDAGTDYSTVYIGGDDTAFHDYGRFDGLAEGVDIGNQNRSDNALVFSDGLNSTAQLTQVIVHETAHLLGYAHDDEAPGQNLLASVADNTFTVVGEPVYVNQNAGQHAVTFSRSDISATQTLYVSTLQDVGDVNEGQYVELDHQAITFEQGKSTAEVALTINDLGLANGSSTFRLILQESPVDPLSPELATANFTIVNNATSLFTSPRATGITTHDTGIVNYLPALSNHGFVGLPLGQDSSYLSAADAALIQAAGMKVFSFYEQPGMSDTDANGDHTYDWQNYYTQAQGEADAAAAYIAATQYAQQPFGSAIYFSVDLNPADTSGITQEQALDAISAYFQGIQNYFSTLPAESTYDIGVMGAGDTLTRVTDDGLAQYTWLAQAHDWPGYSEWNLTSNLPSDANVVQGLEVGPQAQYGNITFDQNSTWALPLGAWGEDTSPVLNISNVSATLVTTHTGAAGSSYSLSLAGHFLDGHTLTFTAPEGAEISFNSRVNFSETLTLTPDKGYINAVKVYIRTSDSATADVDGMLTITSDLDSTLDKSIHITGRVLATPDETRPTVDVLEVSDTSIALDSSVNINYTVSDAGGAGLSTVWVFRAPDVDGVPGSYQTLRTQNVTGDGPFSDVYTDSPAEGTWWYKVEARDQSVNYGTPGNGAPAPVAVTVQDMTPTVSSLSTTEGSTLGGTEVVITGTFFTDATAVFFGDQEATSFTVDSDTQITAITPANEVAGSVDVTVTALDRTSAITPASLFTYRVFTPNLTYNQPEGWAETLVLSHAVGTHATGGFLYNDMDVYLDFSVVNTDELDSGAFDVDLYLNGDHWMTLGTVASLSAGETFSFEDINVGKLPVGYNTFEVKIDAANVVVESNENDNIYSTIKYVYRAPDTVAPVISAFDVTRSVVAPGDVVNFSYEVSDSGGSGLKRVNLVWAEDINGVPAELYYTVGSPIEGDGPVTGQFTRLISQTTGTWWYWLTAQDDDGNVSQGSDFGFGPILMTVQNQPTVSGLDRTDGLIGGGEPLVITGTDFSNATAIHFGDIETTNFTIDSDTQITVIVPPGASAGVVDVTVTTPVGTSPVTGNAQFTYIELLAELEPHEPAGWTDELVISSEAGVHGQPNEYFDNDTLYVNWAVTNSGDVATEAGFMTSLYVDDVLVKEWETVSLMQVEDVITIEDYELGSLSVGSHTIRLVIDSSDTVNEYDDTVNNEVTRVIEVTEAPNLPPAVLSMAPFDEPQNGDVTVAYVLTDEESDLSSIVVQYSDDNGATWSAATAGPGGDGVSNLSTSPSGVSHVFVWNSFADLPNTHNTEVKLRIIVSDDRNQDIIGGASSPFTIDQPPVVSDLSATLTQDTPLALTAIDFASAFSDPDAGDSLVLLGFTSLPEHGTITYNGSPIQLDVVYPVSQIAGLLYTPDAGYTGTDSFGWRASDGSLYSVEGATVNLTIEASVPEPIDLNFDFGTAGSQVLAGALKVTEATTYSEGQGYGWQSGVIDSRDRGALSGTNAQTRDLNFTTQGVFAIDLANGSYLVTVQVGDAENYLHDHMGVAFEDGQYDSINSAKKQVVSRTYEVTVTDGQLNLKLKDLGGIDPNVCIEGLRIVSNIQINHPPTLADMSRTIAQDTTVVFTGSDFTAAFTDEDFENTLQTVKFINLPANGTLELNGSIVTANQEIAASEIYSLVYTPDEGYTGPDSFSWNGSDGELYAASNATVNLQIKEQGESFFDFGTASSPLEVGFNRVTETTTYTAARGYGWQSGTVLSRDRGASGSSNALTQDLHFTKNAVFAVDLTNGTYNVTVQLGDADYPHDQMGVYLENNLQETISTQEGQIVSRTFIVDVTDGQLNLRLRDLGGVDEYVTIVGLQIASGLPVDHPPTQTDIHLGMDEVNTLLFNANDFIAAFTDPDPGDVLMSVTITDLPEYGTLGMIDSENNIVPVTVGQQLSVSQLNDLTYTPFPDQHNDDSFGWLGSNGKEPAVASSRVNVIRSRLPLYDFDFGTESSPLLAGGTRVSHNTTYSAGLGYGWQSGVIDSRDRGALSGTDAQTRDLNFTTEGVFAVDLANGTYEVTVKLGDAENYLHDRMGVAFEDGQYDSINSAKKQVVTRTYEVTVTDGQLNLRLKDLGGIDPNVCIEGLQILRSF